MNKKRYRVLCFCIFLFAAGSLWPMEMEPDSEKNKSDLFLSVESGTSLLEDPEENYLIEGKYRVQSESLPTGHGSFRPGRGGIILHPLSTAMWSPGEKWESFTLDFYLNPSTLNTGEVLFFWRGWLSGAKEQSVVARVENRRIVWEFNNFFIKDKDSGLKIVLKSKPLLPGEWRRHTIRFKGGSSVEKTGSAPGVLEYLVDSAPVDLVYATPTGREELFTYYPVIGKESIQPLKLSPSFNGLIADFRLLPRFLF